MGFHNRFVTKYLNPLEVMAEVRSLVAKFPDLCRLEELPLQTHGYWGEKEEARGRQKMHVLRITSSKGPETKPAVLLMRSQHAREWVNSMAVVESACQLLENYRPDDSDSRVRTVVETLDQVEFMIVPEGNPDGALSSFFDQGRRMWRKNLRPPGAGGCPGVDCNRNFPRYWGEPGSSGDACTEIYRGPSPLSEPEAANISHLAENNRNIVFAIDSHSYGPALFRPNPRGGAYVTELPVSPDDDELYQRLESVMNRQIRLVQGIMYPTGSTSNHAGTTDEYLFFQHRIFAFDLECGQDFQPPIQDAIVAALEVAAATLALGWCATSQSGIDVKALMESRASVKAIAAGTEMVIPPTVPRHKLEALSPEQVRRFSLRLRPKRPSAILQEALDLMERGYDVRRRPVGEIDVIASAVEIESLLREGYKPMVMKDYYAEPSHG
jgi:hypothetical protein